MNNIRVKIKLRLEKKNLFLNLMSKYKISVSLLNGVHKYNKKTPYLNTLQFTKLYIPLLSSFYIFEFTNFWQFLSLSLFKTTTTKNLCYYANFNKQNKYVKVVNGWNFFSPSTPTIF